MAVSASQSRAGWARSRADLARSRRAVAPSVTAAAQVGAGSPAGQVSSWLGNQVGQGIAGLTNAFTGAAQGLGQAAANPMSAVQGFGNALGGAGGYINDALGYLGSLGAQPSGGARAPAQMPQPQQFNQPAGGGMAMFPRQQQEQQFDPQIGLAKLLETMDAIRPQTFGEGMQGAMDTIGGQLNQNAQMVAQDRHMQDFLSNAAAERASRERMGMATLGAMTGREPEQYVMGQERVQAPDRVGDISIGPRNLPGGYTYQDVMGTRLGAPQPAAAAGPVPSAGTANPAAVQDQAAGSLYGQVASAAAPAAFNQGGGIGGFQFAGPGGQFGGATLPSPPWAGGQAGTADMGIDTAGGQVWGPQHQQEAINRLNTVGNATAPYLGANADPAVQGGLQQQFGDFLQGAQAKTYNDLMRGGQQAEASHQLESQVVGSRLQNALWQMMSQMYGSNMGTAGDQNALSLRMLNALA